MKKDVRKKNLNFLGDSTKMNNTKRMKNDS